MKTPTSISKLIFILSLTGCGSGELTMNHAQETANIGNEAVNESKKYFNKMIDLELERAAVILAAQPNCKLSKNWEITVRKNQDPNPNSSTPLCATDLDFKKNNTRQMNLMPLVETRFQRDLDILSAFSDYLAVLTAYTADSAYPVGDLIDKALDNANKINNKNDLTTDQKKSISGLAMFLQRLAIEEKNRRDITETIKKEGGKQVKNMELVRADIHDLKKYYDNVMSSDIFNFTSEMYNRRSHNADTDKSIANAKKIVLLKQQIDKSIREPTAAEIAIDKFQKYNTGLISIIDDNITDKKIKAERLQIQKDNLKEGLGYIKDIVKDFAPLLIAAI